MSIQPGTTFTKKDSRPYTENGARGVHETVIRYRITETDQRGFTADVVEIISETGRPSFAGTATGCSMAWFGFDAAIRRGDLTVEG